VVCDVDGAGVPHAVIPTNAITKINLPIIEDFRECSVEPTTFNAEIAETAENIALRVQRVLR
jgi:hypothetical protein